MCDDTLLLPLYSLSIFTVIGSLEFGTIVIYLLLFHFFIHPLREFKILSSSRMVYPYPYTVWVSHLR